MPGTHKYMFQFHPHSSAVRKLLRYDFEQHHEVKWSFENETDSYPAEKIPHEYLDEWKLAEKNRLRKQLYEVVACRARLRI